MARTPISNDLSRLRSILEEPLMNLDLAELARHNRGYLSDYSSHRFETFVEAEWPSHSRVLKWYLKNIPKGSRVMEIGTFVPVIPILLTWHGYWVTTVEKLSLYGKALDPMIDLLTRMGVTFQDIDIIGSDFDSTRFDVVNLIAILEHLLGSPKQLLMRIQEILVPGGALVLTVPNQARLIRRLGLLLGGTSVQPKYQDYFNSAYPFSGHHREYTRAEVVYALTQSGFRVGEIDSIKYPPKGSFAYQGITLLGNLLPKTFHQAIFAVGYKNDGQISQ